MKASLRSVRIAPKKANLVAKMVRGLTVPQALASLERTNKKAARLLEELVKSAIANARHNDKQDPDTLVIRNLTVNKAQAFHRGVPMARGRVRPMRKFLSHIELTLGIADSDSGSGSKDSKPEPETRTRAKSTKTASQAAAKPVQTTTKSPKGTSASAKKKDTSASRSPSARTSSKKTPAKKTSKTSPTSKTS